MSVFSHSVSLPHDSLDSLRYCNIILSAFQPLSVVNLPWVFSIRIALAVKWEWLPYSEGSWACIHRNIDAACQLVETAWYLALLMSACMWFYHFIASKVNVQPMIQKLNFSMEIIRVFVVIVEHSTYIGSCVYVSCVNLTVKKELRGATLEAIWCDFA